MQHPVCAGELLTSPTAIARCPRPQTIGMLLEAVFSGEGLEAFFGGLARWAGGEARALNEPSLKAASAAEAAPAQPRPAAGLAASGGPTLLSLLDFLVPQVCVLVGVYAWGLVVW